MKSRNDGCGYNERLFSGGLRSKLHLARFKWLQAEIRQRNCSTASVLELGCFDGKLIDHLTITPRRYVGFDANWEGGLDSAKTRWADTADYLFFQATTPEEMCLDGLRKFDLAVAMETFEHIPPHLVDGYLSKIAENLEGYFFVTVPNEKGPFFLTKWLAKKFLSRDAEQYSLSELVNATLGRMDQVSRREHKGFDYAVLIDNLEKHFDVIAVSGFPFGLLPNSLCFGIGIVAKSRG